MQFCQEKKTSHPHINITAVWKHTVVILSLSCKSQFLRLDCLFVSDEERLHLSCFSSIVSAFRRKRNTRLKKSSNIAIHIENPALIICLNLYDLRISYLISCKIIFLKFDLSSVITYRQDSGCSSQILNVSYK